MSGEGLESPEKSDTEGYHRTYDPVVTSLHHDVQAETGGLLLYASTKNESRSRRPTDLALALLSLLGLVISATVSQIGGSVDAGFADFVTSIPNLLDPLWKVLFWAPVAWGAILLIISVMRDRLPLARDMALGGLASLVVAVVTAAIVTGDAWNVITLFGDPNGPPTFPPGALTLAVAMLSTASPHLTRPFRHFGRWLLIGQLAGTLLLGGATLTGAFGAIAAGLLAACSVHLIVGSPGGRPTTSRIELALQGLGVPVDHLALAAMHREGVVMFEGSDAQGTLSVKVYGRDAWDGQLLANLWRLAWYRESEQMVRFSRVELVEHEGFVTLLAERAGVRVPHIVTAGSAGHGDALVVVRPDGTPLSVDESDASEAGLAALWDDLHRLHRGGMVHNRIDLDRIVTRTDGSLGFGDLSSATVSDSPTDLVRDEAQVVGLSIVLFGQDDGIAAARASLGDDAFAKVLPYLQDAAMAPHVRRRLADADLDLDDIRDELQKTLGTPEQPLIRLRRVSTRSLVNLALLAFAAYALISIFADMDLDLFIDALGNASWWWLALALLLAQLPRVPAAISTMGAVENPLPFGPLFALQFAICYVNLAIPSTAARVAVNVRFLQRFGVKPATAMSAGVIDSVSGFILQIVLFLLLFFNSDLDLGLTLDTGELSGVATLALITVIVFLIAGLVIVSVPSLRRKVLGLLREARDSLNVLRSPRKLALLFGGNLAAQVLFAVACSACVRAFGESVPLGEVLLISIVVSLFAGLLPIPGGIGVSEAGFTLGLTAAGVPAETAFAISLAYRFVSFYLPPIWGWFCYRWLVRQRYL